MKFLTDFERLQCVHVFVRAAHNGQIDKVGRPYIEHLERVASKMNTIERKIIAFMHDVVEDERITQEELHKLHFLTDHEKCCIDILNKNRTGFGICDLRLLAQIPKDMVYITGVRNVENTRLVKIADIEDNMNIVRFFMTGNTPEHKDQERLLKYESQLRFLRFNGENL